MTLPLVATVVIAALALGYTLYGRLVARSYALDDARPTPAVRRSDGVDFVPTRPFYLLGQHLSAIAAAGPIAGPILACREFGWAPCLVWIVLGVVFIGSVHDLSALVASVRHEARSIAEIVRQHLGRRAGIAILAFLWVALVYVILAFTDITAQTFLGRGDEAHVHRGGAVAASSTAYLALAVVMGLAQRFLRPPLWLVTLVFVPATLGCVWLGTVLSHGWVLGHAGWSVAILGYCFVASILPLWVLLQPRGYLGGFVLYISLAVGVLGIFLGGFEVKQPATTNAPLLGLAGSGSLFPFLFVTIACGACSGFHGLVCSGTTSKQLARESHCRPIGYGAMLLEGFVAVIALGTIMVLSKEQVAGKPPGDVYGQGLASFLRAIVPGIDPTFAITFATMVFATFIFDTIDVATRLGRYVLQELFGWTGRAAAIRATALTAGVPLAILLATGEGGYRTFWLLFGTSNQLLAGLTLLGITVWLRRSGRRAWFTAVPMVFVLTITLWSLVGQAIGFFGQVRDPATGAFRAPALANGVLAVALVALASFLVLEAVRGRRRAAAEVPA
jgi:carbon starvation protein